MEDTFTIFKNLELLKIEVDEREYNSFKKYIFEKQKIGRFQLQSLVGLFIVDFEKMQFRLVERFNHFKDTKLITEVELEFEIIFLFKMAKKMGFDIFFENKYSN